MLPQQNIVIVGAGIVGLSTAYALLAQGMRNVTVLEQEVVDHARSSSHGFSRLLRFEYGSDAFYSNMVRLSLKRWRTLNKWLGAHFTHQQAYSCLEMMMILSHGRATMLYEDWRYLQNSFLKKLADCAFPNLILSLTI